MERPEAFRLVRDKLADILDIDPSSIGEGTSFKDLGTDSVHLITLVEGIEEELARQGHEVRIDDEDLADLFTVRDAVDCILNLIQAKPASASSG